jgi:ubiquinone/menaquinone biosynthesis C-methylase UbiE
MYVPGNAALAALHRLYLLSVLPMIGKLVFGKSGSQEYLADTIFGFDQPSEFSERLRKAGFSDVNVRPLSGGIAVLHSAAKNL